MERSKIILDDRYLNLNCPSAYSGFTNLKKECKKDGVTSAEIMDYLGDKKSYTLHQPVIRRHKKDVVMAYNIDDSWHLDLADMSAFSDQNDNIKFILVAVDVLSKFAFVSKLPNKTTSVVKNGLNEIFVSSSRKPNSIYCDKGLEFTSNVMKQYLEKEGVEIYFAENTANKACIAERFIRTLKTRLWRYFTENNTNRFVDVLDKVVDAYNNTEHRSIGCTPSSVTPENFLHVWKKLYSGKCTLPGSKAKYKIGDYVRISKIKSIFSKGYESNYTEEVFQITKIFLKNPVMYKICDLDEEEVLGRFYERELVKVKLPQEFEIDKIISTRGKGSRKEYLVSWKGYPKKFHSWVREQAIRNGPRSK